MKRTSLWCAFALACALAFPALGAQAKDKMAGDEAKQAVADLEQKWIQAVKTNNPQLIAPNLAEGLTDTDESGTVSGKAETLNGMKGAKYTTAELGDMKVMVYGDTAIATGNFTGKGTDEKGQSMDIHERWTDTWIKMSGKWQCVATHSSSIKM